jgi:putative endonuclease
VGLFAVYIIRSITTQKHYIGQTNDLEDRLHRHNSNRNKYTRGKGPWELIALFETETRSEAVQIESYLKKLKNPEKAIKYLGKLSQEKKDKV